MNRKTIRDKEDVQVLIQWMAAPLDNKPPVDFDAGHFLERLEIADLWMRTHMSIRKVVPMLVHHWTTKGLEYSQRTARRDCEDAQELFPRVRGHKLKYWTDAMLDSLGEDYVACRLAGKYKEAKGVADVILKYLLLAERAGIQDSKSLLAEVPRQILFAPEEMGYERNPNARAEAEQWIEMRKAEKLQGRLPIGTVTITRTDADAGDITG